jgi:hypothetical protein
MSVENNNAFSRKLTLHWGTDLLLEHTIKLDALMIPFARPSVSVFFQTCYKQTKDCFQFEHRNGVHLSVESICCLAASAGGRLTDSGHGHWRGSPPAARMLSGNVKDRRSRPSGPLGWVGRTRSGRGGASSSTDL